MAPDGLDAKKDANIKIKRCEGIANQFFKWEDQKFTVPNIGWKQIACDQNGGITKTY